MRKFKLDKNRSGRQFNRKVLVCSKQVASVEGMHVTRTDLQCLGPRELVCSLVINIFVEYLNEIGKEDWYVPTYFGRNSIKMGDNMSTQEWIQQTKRIFIPMHEPGIQEKDAHWYLLVEHVRDRSAEILDSAPNPSKTISRQRDARAALDMLDRIYGDAMSRHANRLFAFGTLPFKADGAGPRQKNDTDCGVFVIRNMQRYGTDWAATYNSDIERAVWWSSV
ncbi:hypothetical protein ABKV19_026365 [Rosa sericea]